MDDLSQWDEMIRGTRRGSHLFQSYTNRAVTCGPLRKKRDASIGRLDLLQMATWTDNEAVATTIGNHPLFFMKELWSLANKHGFLIQKCDRQHDPKSVEADVEY